MQQVAAQKIDIAAQSFSASKSVDSGDTVVQDPVILADSDKFRAFYSDAKQEKAPYHKDAKSEVNIGQNRQNTSGSEQKKGNVSSDASVSAQARSNATNDVNSQDGNVNLPTPSNETLDAETLVEANEFTPGNTSVSAEARAKGIKEIDPEQGNVNLPVPAIDSAEADTLDSVNDTKSPESTLEQSHLIAPGFETGVNNTDWIDYVETMLGAKLTQEAGHGNNPPASSTEIEGLLSSTLQGSSAEILSAMPADVDVSSVTSVSTYLVTQLEGQTEPPYTDEVISAVKALASLLTSANTAKSAGDVPESKGLLSSDPLGALLAQFTGQNGSDTTSNNVGEAITTAEKGGVSAEGEASTNEGLASLSADEALILSLLQDAMGASKASPNNAHSETAVLLDNINTGKGTKNSDASELTSTDLSSIGLNSEVEKAEGALPPQSAEGSLLNPNAKGELAQVLSGELSDDNINSEKLTIELDDTATSQVQPNDQLNLAAAQSQVHVSEAHIPSTETTDGVTVNAQTDAAQLDIQQITDEQALALNTASIEEAPLNFGLINGEISNSKETIKDNNVFASKNDADNQPLADIEHQSETLLESLSLMSPASAQKATEAFAERMVASLPATTNPAQQQAVKTALISSINEFQQQLAQGHEPGIDLSAMVADAVSEAGLLQSQAQTMARNADALAGQFMQLVGSAQHAANETLQNQFTHVDTHVAENNQVRVESSKTQLQIDSGEKGVNIHKPEGQQQLHEKIRWMVNARNPMAEIRLDPPELGSMQVRVNVSGDAASVSFVVQSQHAKEVLADAMPKLKEMLADQGIALGDAEVRKDNSSQNREGNGQQLAGDASSSRDNDGELEEQTRVIEQRVTHKDKGGIDYYA